MADEVYETGQKPGAGQYQCLKCGKIITLEKDSDELPTCPKCGYIRFKKTG